MNAEPVETGSISIKAKSVNKLRLYWLEVMLHFEIMNMNSFKYRDRVTIYRDMLKTIKRSDNRGRKYSIMKHASLSYDQLTKYLIFLSNMGYIREIHEPDGKKYAVTDQGSVFLKGLEDLRLHLHHK